MHAIQTNPIQTNPVQTSRCQTSRRPAIRRPRRGPVAGSVDPQAVRTVSAMTMRADAEVRSMPRPTVPNYALRRLAVAVGAAVCCALLVMAAVGVLAGFGSAAVASDASVDRGAPSAHVAEIGDTLWSIAAAHHGDVDHDRYLDALIRKNGGVDIRVGQVVWLP